MSEDKSKITPITEKEINEKSMSTLPTRPNSNGLYGETKLTPSELKERMDALALLAIDRINKLIGGMQAGGEVAKTIKFQYGEEGTEYSLADLFSMIFSHTGLSNILVTRIRASDLATETQPETDGYITLNVALENLFTNIEAYKTEINKTLEQIKTEINNAFDELKNYADSLVA